MSFPYRPIVMIPPLGPPYPLACTPANEVGVSEYEWYEYQKDKAQVVNHEVDRLWEDAPTQITALDWRAAIQARIDSARLGRVPRQKDFLRRMERGDGVYELKIALDPVSQPPVLARLYQVDLDRAGALTIGCFRASLKQIDSNDSFETQCAQDEEIELASKRCDRLCSEGDGSRLTTYPAACQVRTC